MNVLIYCRDLFFSFYLLETWSHLNFNLFSSAEYSDCGREKAIQARCWLCTFKIPCSNLTIKQVFVYICTNCFFSMLITLYPKCSEGQVFSLFHIRYTTKKKQLVWWWFIAAQLSISTCSPFPFCSLALFLLFLFFFSSFFFSPPTPFIGLLLSKKILFPLYSQNGDCQLLPFDVKNT